MANLQEILEINNGSFEKSEQMAKAMISRGQVDVLLDLALIYHCQGKRDLCRQTQEEYSQYYPSCPRLKFVSSWFDFYDGNLSEALEKIEAGRSIGCFGLKNFSKFNSPIWDGKIELNRKTVLLLGEGGFGDQILGFRAVNWLKEKGAKVIVGCSPELTALFSGLEECSAVVNSEVAHHVSFDFLVPMMSAPRLCQREWENLWSQTYIVPKEKHACLWDKIIPKEEGLLNVGLRWKGNPEFEHEQFRTFPHDLMLGLTKALNCRFWSFQKDDKTAPLPDNVIDLDPFLGNWDQTALALSRMDLVISSCTSVAHLSASLGRPTWIVVPAMPYYPWAKKGNKSDWYPTATLFKQEKYGEWESVFSDIFLALKNL